MDILSVLGVGGWGKIIAAGVAGIGGFIYLYFKLKKADKDMLSAQGAKAEQQIEAEAHAVENQLRETIKESKEKAKTDTTPPTIDDLKF